MAPKGEGQGAARHQSRARKAIDAHFVRMHVPGPSTDVAAGVDEWLAALGGYTNGG